MDMGFDPILILRLKLIYRIGVSAGLIAIILAAYWYVWFTDAQDRLAQLDTDIQKQEDDIKSKRLKLLHRPQLEKDLAALERQDAEASKELPNKKEIPDLLTGVSALGHNAGLEFILFAPQGEVKHDIYAEVPVDVTLMGNYNQLGSFLDHVSKMPRIVNASNLVITPAPIAAKDGSGLASPNLTTSARITTYRFLDPATEIKGGKPQK